MPRYVAKMKGYDGVKVREKGEKFDFDGKPGKWMEPLDAKKSGGSKGSASKNASPEGEGDASPDGKGDQQP